MVALATCAWSPPVRAQSCANDAECASPLTCKSPGTICSQGGTRLPDGGMYVSDPVCQPEPAECVWVFVACQNDGDCTMPNWGCLAVPGQTAVKTCFPKYIACSPDQPCPTGWLCIDSARAYPNEPLQIWGLERGGPNYCWPSSLGGTLTGSTHTDSSGLGLPTPDGGTGVRKGDGGTGATLLLDAATTGADLGAQASSNADSGTTLSLDAATTGPDLGAQVAPNADSGTTVSPGSDAPVVGPEAGTQVPPTAGSAPASSGCGCRIAGQSTSDRFALLALVVFGLLCLGRTAREE